ncbi:MAG TPA: PIN domain-containing protein [Actinomycetota bacterium]|nr:PIN domain-containing protein [Actinomycetota bacterium]
MSRAVLVDTSIFAYALGDGHAYREPCRDFLATAAANGLELHASVEMVQELTFHRMRRVDAQTAVAQGRLAAAACELHAFDEKVLDRALSLVLEGMRGRDAVHAATAAVAGISVIVSTDPGFDSVMERLSP